MNIPFMIIALLTASLMMSSPLRAAEPQAAEDKFSFMFGFESKSGGDDVGSLVNDGEEKGDVEAGSGMNIYAGVVLKPVDYFETRISAGYHFDRSKTETGTVYMDRTVIDLIPTFAYHIHRLGLGATYHINPTLDGDDFNKSDIEFDNAWGYLVEYGVKVTPFLYLGVRYVGLDYDIKTEGVQLNGSSNVDASHVGLNLYFEF